MLCSNSKTHPKFLRRSRSLANLALRLKQHITIRANNGKPKIHDTIGMIIFSGVTMELQSIFEFKIISFLEFFILNLTRWINNYSGKLFVLLIYASWKFRTTLTCRHYDDRRQLKIPEKKKYTINKVYIQCSFYKIFNMTILVYFNLVF